jgi:DNA-directed RNA polymerase subunit RPC12/RpoP
MTYTTDEAIDPIIFPRHKRHNCRYIRCVYCGKEFSVDREKKSENYTCPDCAKGWREYERREIS